MLMTKLTPHQERTLDALVKFTKNCNYEMHEPCNQGISAYTEGIYLDNAFGNTDMGNELLVVLTSEKPDENGFSCLKLNLATVISLARAVEPLIDYIKQLEGVERNA